MVFGRFGDPLEAKVLDAITQQPGIGRREIHKALGNHVKGTAIVDILAGLRDAKKIRAEILKNPGGGRPSERWFPCEQCEQCEQTPGEFSEFNGQPEEMEEFTV
jgi:hypothetical protein